MSREVYLDNNATTQPLPEVIEAIGACMRCGWANPSSAHRAGRRAAQLLERARDEVRDLAGVSEHKLIFTTGASESNTMVFQSILFTGRHRRVITTSAEHSSMLANAEVLASHGFEVVYLQVDTNGHVDQEALKRELRRGADLVAVHWVNNETGVIQPIAEIGAQCVDSGIPLLVDGAQAFGKLAFKLSEMPITYLSFSGHKFHGPPGVGGLIAANTRALRPLLRGGDQEGGLRGGTYNLPAIIGLGEAARLRRGRLDLAIGHMFHLRNVFEGFVTSRLSAAVNGHISARVANTSNLCFKGLDGQALLARLDSAGIFVSQGSACTSRRPEPSHVLTAMGLSEEDAYASIRFSFSELNHEDEVRFAVAQLDRHCEVLRSVNSEAGSIQGR
jgi:cysteine desulfurase